MKKTLLVVGYGNMAQAILTRNHFITSHFNVLITGRDLQKAKDCIAKCEIEAQIYTPQYRAIADSKSMDSKPTDSKAVLDIQDSIVLLCTKPKGLQSFIFEGKAQCVYSVLAGVGIDTLEKQLQSCHIVRLMPNIAAFSKNSATAFYHKSYTQHTDSKADTDILAFLESFGKAVSVDNEALIESSIATSGSSIAFLALIAESLIDAGILEGLTHAQSQNLVKQTFLGFATELATKSPSELKYAISSPGGTTIRGLAILEELGVRGAFIKAAHTAAEHARDSKK